MVLVGGVGGLRLRDLRHLVLKGGGWLVCVVVRFLFYYATTPKELDVLWVEPPQAECRFPCTVVSCSLGRLLGHWHNTCDLKCFGSWESADLPTYVAH